MTDPTDIIPAAPVPEQVTATLPTPRLILETDDHDTVCAKLCAFQNLKERFKEFCAEFTDSAKSRLDDLGPVEAGDQLYYSGIKKLDPEPVNIVALADALFMAVGGDWEAFLKHFCKDPLKISECANTLGKEENEKHWNRPEAEKFISDDLTPRKLMNASKRWIEYAKYKRNKIDNA